MSEIDNGASATNDEVVTTLPEGMDDPQALKQEIARRDEAQRQILARAKRAEAELKAEREARIKAETKPAPNIIKEEYSLNDEIVDLRLDGYSKGDVEFIMKNGGRKALEDKTSYTAIAINARKEQARAEAEANKVNDTSGMTEVERKYTPEQMKNMSATELKKILPHA